MTAKIENSQRTHYSDEDINIDRIIGLWSSLLITSLKLIPADAVIAQNKCFCINYNMINTPRNLDILFVYISCVTMTNEYI